MKQKQRGFTLLEVMLAIAILSSLALLAATVFSQALESYQRAQKLTQHFTDLQRTDLLLSNDLMQLVARKNRQTNQVYRTATNSIIFSTQTLSADGLAQSRSTLITVHWYLKDHVLYRAVRAAPDSKEEPSPRAMLADVTRFTTKIENAEDGSTPAQATVTLEFSSAETVRRHYVLPDWFPKYQQTNEVQEHKNAK